MKGRKRAKVVKKTISLPDVLLARGLARGQAENRNFSSYVQNLISKDIEGANLPEVAKEKAVAA